MRTTLTLDPDVARRIEQEAHQKGKTVRAVANEVLRAGLGLHGKAQPSQPFRIEPHDFGFRPGIDLNKMNQLADELETAEVSKKLGT